MLKILRDLSMTWMMITMCSIRSLFNISLIFSSLNLNDVLIHVLDEFRARKIFILVWSNIIWSLQFIWSVPIVCAYIEYIWSYCERSLRTKNYIRIPNNSKIRNHFSMQKSFHHFIAYPKHQKISIRLFVIQLLGLCN